MRSAIRALVFGALFSLVFVGCGCEPEPPTSGADPEPVFTPQTFDFGGLCAGDVARQELTVENKGRGHLNLRLSFEGEAGASFRAEREGEVIDSLAVAAGRAETIEIVYEPTGSTGDQEAWLEVKTNSKRKPQEELLLTGFLSPNPVKPDLRAAWALCRDEDLCIDSRDPCCVSPPALDHQGKVNVGEVGIEQEGRVRLALESRGCAPVEITQVEIVQQPLGPGDEPCREGDLRLEIPDEGLVLPPAVRVGEHELDVVFQPSWKCLLDARMILHTTDPERPTIALAIEGQGVGGSLTVVGDNPVVFGNVRKGDHVEKTIRLVNFGSDEAEVTNIEVTGDHGEHFELVRVEQCAAEVLNYPVMVGTGDPNANCEANLHLVVHYKPQNPGEHGYGSNLARVLLEEADGNPNYVRLQGTSLPKMRVYPSHMITFSSPAQTGCGSSYECGPCTRTSCETDNECPVDQKCLDSICVGMGNETSEAVCATTCSTARRTVLICNEGHNDLELHSIRFFEEGGYPDGKEGSPVDTFPDSVTFNEPIFRLDTGSCGSGAGLGTLEYGECCEVYIDLQDNNKGGMVDAELVIETNEGKDPEPILVQKNTVTIPAPRLPANFNKSHTPKVNQEVVISAVATADHGGIGRYIWEMTITPGPHPQANALALPEGILDPADPDNVIVPFTQNERNPCQREKCYELRNEDDQPCNPDGSDCSRLVFYPLIAGEHHFKLTVESDVCGPPEFSSRTDLIQVEQ